MNKRVYAFAAAAVLVVAGGVAAQGMIMDMVTNKVITKYQNASCEQLWVQKGEPKSAEEQRFVQALHNNPQIRTEFINRVAGPIVNKMFECGMIP
jgi:hypothetical protein